MARLYLDENVQVDLADALHRLGHDVVTALDDGRANQHIPDAQVLHHASLLTRSVVTCDRGHYKRLHRATRRRHAGIVTCSQFLDVTEMAIRVDEAVRAFEPLDGRLVNVYLGSAPTATD